MASSKPDALSDISKALFEKAPASIKEVSKVLVEMTSKFVEAMGDLKMEMNKMDGTNNSMKAELTSIRQSVGYMNESFEEYRNEIKSLKLELSEVKNQGLECKKENLRLNKELQETKKQLIELNQYSRRNNLELRGIPKTENEDVLETVEEVASCLNVQLSDGDIDVAHHVPSKGNTPPNASNFRTTASKPGGSSTLTFQAFFAQDRGL
ncbi:hypothetical protein HPB50_019966 [Hyalomma asiaticum]|uniref:Uncharacterized protein n=1 Tax=Hyalomma asiaticum TaxID=266040 RepID=A0ACB7T064_HYAAI|nr:hypothetical protein HPB50_019966 [Hyalomma asiaticum]